jgi:hypothetical protein
MPISNRSIQSGFVAVLSVLSVVQINAQVLPRNRDGAKQDAKTVEREVQRTDDGTAVEREVQRSRDGAAVDKDRTRTRGRTGVDTNRTDSATAVTRTTGNILRSTQIVGAYVNVQSDQRLGKVTEIVFNEGGCISYLIVDIEGRMAPIPWQAGRYDYQQRVFLLTEFDEARIARIPTFTTYDQFADDKYVTQVNTYFNVRGDSNVNVRTDVDARSTERSTNRARGTQSDAKAAADSQSQSKLRTSNDVNKQSDKSRSTTNSKDKKSAPAPRQPSDSNAQEKDTEPSSEKSIEKNIEKDTEKDNRDESPK